MNSYIIFINPSLRSILSNRNLMILLLYLWVMMIFDKYLNI